jgi:hypothetical protein
MNYCITFQIQDAVIGNIALTNFSTAIPYNQSTLYTYMLSGKKTIIKNNNYTLIKTQLYLDTESSSILLPSWQYNHAGKYYFCWEKIESWAKQ